MSRVPGTAARHSFHREIATAGDPVGALLRAVEPIGRHGGVWSIGVSHDDGCPAIETGPMRACTCEIVRIEARRAA